MRVYSVHQSPSWSLREDARPEDGIVFVREGFSWGALLLPLLWALWHRLWLVALGLVAVAAAVDVAVVLLGLGAFAEAAATAVVMLWFGFEGNDLRRWTLRRRDWRDLGIVAAGSLAGAEQRFFGGWRPGLRPAARGFGRPGEALP